MIDKDEYVYCTNCINYEITLDCMPNNHCGECKCSGCDCQNAEDGIRFEDRPNYIEVK
jgi:hypothetical protein